MTTTRTTRQRKSLSFASMILAGALALGGCASAADATTTSAVSSSSGASISTISAADESTDSSTTAETIAETTAAVEAFLETLSDEQRETVLYDYDDETKTTSWSNFPVTFVQRAGLNLNDLTEEQQAAAMKVLEALLSDEGYATVTGIIGGDEFLAENSSSTEDSLGQYYIAFFGEASTDSAYEIQFGGHHLASTPPWTARPTRPARSPSPPPTSAPSPPCTPTRTAKRSSPWPGCTRTPSPSTTA